MMRRRQDGQALTEFAFALPIFMLLVFVTIQLSLLFVAYYSETRMARETARWLAINESSLDTAVAQHVYDTMLPGLARGAYTVDASSNNTDAYYHVGRMNMKFTACNPKFTTPTPASPCLNTNRTSGQTLYVELTYDVSNLIFLPTNFRFGWLSAKIPTNLPPYKVSVMVE